MFSFGISKKIQFITRKNENVIIDKTLPNETVYLSKSEKCSFDISTPRIMKFITEECKEITLKISSSITTSTIEIFKSSKLEFILNSCSNTITVEDSNDVKLTLGEKCDWKDLNLITKGCNNFFVHYNSLDYQILAPENSEKHSQLISRIVDDKLVTTVLIRKGLVGVTVKEEDKERIEKNEKKKQEMFSQFRNLETSSKIEKKEEKKIHKDSSIIIIRSGMAGIPAAKKLLELINNS